MRKIIATGLAAATLLSGLGIGSTASAQWRHHYYHHGGGALAAGIAGLAVGAAIAGSHPYYGPYGYYYGPRCRYYTVWDPYYGAYIHRRRCW